MQVELYIRKRLLILTVALIGLFTLVGLRIGGLTIFDAEALTQRGVDQWTREGVVSARRGDVQDRNGETLVISATAYIVTANPRQIKDVEAFASILCPILSIDKESAVKKLSDKTKASVILKRQVDRATVDGIRERMASDEAGVLAGIIFGEDTKRWYPKGAFLSQALGLTNVDSMGQSGLEQQFEDVLKGKKGRYVSQVDAKSRAIPDGQSVYIEPETGNTLRLTIDASIQSFCERAMRECIEVNDANAVHCLVMDVKTGEILAMASKPDYDPNEPPRNDLERLQSLMRISLVSDAYEPGSTFKILTSAAAIDSGATTKDDHFYCSAKITVDGDTIRCWGNPHGAETMTQGLYNSCNPVFVELALRMGQDTFYKYLRAFGLGVKTGITLPGEGSGIMINSAKVKNVDLARIGFGQSIAVTPIQLLTAACSVINGGKLMKPYIVKEIVSPSGEVLEKTAATVVATPISPETSAIMREMLEGVVRDGGAKNAAIAGYRIGGKTGTAQVYKDGKIARDVHIGSFLGFAPADAPEFAILVIVDEAKVAVDYGGTTAAPFARQVMQDVLDYMGLKKTDPKATPQPMVPVPDVRGLTVGKAKMAAQAAGFSMLTDGQGDTVTDQMPPPGVMLAMGGQMMAYTYQEKPIETEDLVKVPDVTGLSIVEANRLLRSRDLPMLMEGSGLAVSQRPMAGEYVMPQTEVTVKFEIP